MSKAKKQIFIALIVALAIIGGLVAFSGLYVVNEMQQAVIIQFGEIVAVTEEPGLHWKIPFVQKANYFEKRLLEWDGEAKQIPTRGKKFITVDSWARWKIVDPRNFFESVTTRAGGQAALDDRIESALRDSISSHMLEETVRSSDMREMEYVTKEIEEAQDTKSEIQLGRDTLVEKVKKTANEELEEDYGLRLVDVQIKRLNYVERVRSDVYERMRSERTRISQKFLSEARSRKNKILGEMQQTLDSIQSEGYREAETIRGEADAQAMELYAGAYSKSPEFFGFLRTVESYEKVLDEKTFLLLTTESDFFRYLEGDLPAGQDLDEDSIPDRGDRQDEDAE